MATNIVTTTKHERPETLLDVACYRGRGEVIMHSEDNAL